LPRLTTKTFPRKLRRAIDTANLHLPNCSVFPGTLTIHGFHPAMARTCGLIHAADHAPVRVRFKGVLRFARDPSAFGFAGRLALPGFGSASADLRRSPSASETANHGGLLNRRSNP